MRPINQVHAAHVNSIEPAGFGTALSAVTDRGPGRSFTTRPGLAGSCRDGVAQAAELSRLWGSMTNFFAAPLSKSL